MRHARSTYRLMLAMAPWLASCDGSRSVAGAADRTRAAARVPGDAMPDSPTARYAAVGDLLVDLGTLSAAQRESVRGLIGNDTPHVERAATMTAADVARRRDALSALLTPTQRVEALARRHATLTAPPGAELKAAPSAAP